MPLGKDRPTLAFQGLHRFIGIDANYHYPMYVGGPLYTRGYHREMTRMEYVEASVGENRPGVIAYFGDYLPIAWISGDLTHRLSLDL